MGEEPSSQPHDQQKEAPEDNSFNVSDEGSPGVFSGIMNDSFSLAGSGPARLSNGFQGIFSTDFTTFTTITPLKSRGDPIDFATVP